MATKKAAKKEATKSAKRPAAKHSHATHPAHHAKHAKHASGHASERPGAAEAPGDENWGPSRRRVRVRMYRQGLGDCFLVTFNPDDAPVHALIDCGTLGAKTTGVTMPAVVADIAAAALDPALGKGKSHLHLLIATHEHKDHVSGFGTQQEAFDAFQVDRVWQAWTEDKSDPLARDVAKYRGDLVNAVALAANAMAARGSTPAHPMHATVRGLLDFVGDVPDDGAPLLGAALAKTVQAAMAYVTGRAGPDKVDFLKPGDVLEPKWLPGVRVYVLGPPRDADALRNMGEHGSADLYEFTARLTRDLAESAQFRLAALGAREYKATLAPPEQELFDRALPFDPRFRVEPKDDPDAAARFPAYFRESDAWRRIDHDWLGGGSDLALQLDSYTNNTSLALAFEFIDDGRVLLFPADAQLGNWLSWHDLQWEVAEGEASSRRVKAADLLGSTVFYKAGHHASHNATPTTKGLELMTRDDLVAMIPLDRDVALAKTPPWLMPADALYARLVERTRGRVLRSDTGWPEDEHRPASVSAEEWQSAQNDPRVNVQPLYIEFSLW